MKASDENPRRANLLNDEELEEISGGTVKQVDACFCPNCNATLNTIEGSLCPWCMTAGIKSRMVRVPTV